MSTDLRWNELAPRYHETGDAVEGAYVVAFDVFTERWIAYRWEMIRGVGYRHLSLSAIEGAATLAEAKAIAKRDMEGR